MMSKWRSLDPGMMERLMIWKTSDIQWHHEQQPPHWYVHMLGVVPRARGRGLGRKLLGVVFGWADQAALPVYLECAQDNVAFYKNLGFREIWKEEVGAEADPFSFH